ncbi:hypothetical protein MRB53_037082 [Persea americana]|nr:hypothetical protein MRB53_037082 [Persea americana]
MVLGRCLAMMPMRGVFLLIFMFLAFIWLSVSPPAFRPSINVSRYGTRPEHDWLSLDPRGRLIGVRQFWRWPPAGSYPYLVRPFGRVYRWSPVSTASPWLLQMYSHNHVIAAASLGKTSELLTSSHLKADTEKHDLQGKIVIPGLVNTHAHLVQSLLRGLAEAVPLHTWLCDSIWPLEASYSENDGRVAAQLTIAEMLLSGTTTFLEALLPAQSGIEGIVDVIGSMDGTASLLADARDKKIESMSIAAAVEAHNQFHGSFDDRLHIWMAAVTPRGSSKAAHRSIGEACREKDIGLTMHCAEAPKDLEIYREHYQCSPMEFCRDTALTSRKTVLAHMVNLDLARDLPILRDTGTTVAHNPSSNCKLASGIASVPQMLAAGVNVSLGTDGGPCANTYDMFREMHLAGIIHKGNQRDASLVDAFEVLAMATINGARALGLDGEIGSLEVGKKADIVVVDPSGMHSAPYDADQVASGGCDPVTTVVYTCTSADVHTVVVDGRVLVQNHKLVRVDEDVVKQAARDAVRGVRQRAGIGSNVFRRLNYV